MFQQVMALVFSLSVQAAAGMPQSARIPEELQQTHEAVATSVRDAPQLTVFDVVHASISEGVVTLTGKVTQSAKRDAVRLSVEQIQGVRGVHDLIAVLPPSKADDDLRERIARSVYGHATFWRYAMMSRPPVRIIVEGGHVVLTGVVQTEGERVLARALAMQSGARSVEDELETK